MLTSILQLDPVGLPQWMMRSIVDSPALVGRAKFRVGVSFSKQSKKRLTKKMKNKREKQDTKANSITSENQVSAEKEPDSIGSGTVPHPRIYDYNILAVLGRGGYGKVLLVQKKQSNLKKDGQSVLYAMKVIRKAILTKEKQVERTLLERDIMARSSHPFVVNLHTAFQTPENLYMVMEFAQGGDLFTHLHRDGPFLESRVRVYACEIILALEHLNSAGVIYRDLKPENILLDAEGHIKIVDFGLARAFTDVKESNNISSQTEEHGKVRFPSSKYQTKSFAGTERYMAPECFCRNHIRLLLTGFSLESLGRTLTRRHPFPSKSLRNDEAYYYDLYTCYVYLGACHLCQVKYSILDSCCNATARRLEQFCPQLGKSTRDHVWFSAINWDAALRRELNAGFVPTIASANDVSNFDDVFYVKWLSFLVNR